MYKNISQFLLCINCKMDGMTEILQSLSTIQWNVYILLKKIQNIKVLRTIKFKTKKKIFKLSQTIMRMFGASIAC